MERKAVQGSLNCMQGTYMIVCTPLSRSKEGGNLSNSIVIISKLDMFSDNLQKS